MNHEEQILTHIAAGNGVVQVDFERRSRQVVNVVLGGPPEIHPIAPLDGMITKALKGLAARGCYFELTGRDCWSGRITEPGRAAAAALAPSSSPFWAPPGDGAN